MARDRFLAMGRAAGPDRFAKQYDALANRADHWDDLKGITAPTTYLLWGEDDPHVSVAVGRRMVEAIPTAQLVTLRLRPFSNAGTAGSDDWRGAYLACCCPLGS